MSMISISKRRLIILLVGFGLTLILVGLVPLVMAQEATSTPEPIETSEPVAATPEAAPSSSTIVNADAPKPTGNNSYCAVCHNQPWRTKTLANGNMLNLYVDPEVLEGSVHGINNPQGKLGCVDCHGTDAFPHNQPDPADSRAYTIASIDRCYACHEKQKLELESGLHEEAILAGDNGAAVCTDCHGAHNIQRVASQAGLVAGVCGDCHTTTLTEWQMSAHVEIGSQGCATCHSPHSQRLRIDSESSDSTPDEVCTNCHKQDEDLPNLPDLWVHTQHRGNLATEMNVACVECHMYVADGTETITDATTDTTSVSNPSHPTGHSMLLDTAPCTHCHEQLVSSEAPAVEATPAEAQHESEGTSTASDGDQTNLVQLLQGLILGLGFGITGAAVFITRGNRR